MEDRHGGVRGPGMYPLDTNKDPDIKKDSSIDSPKPKQDPTLDDDGRCLNCLLQGHRYHTQQLTHTARIT